MDVTMNLEKKIYASTSLAKFSAFHWLKRSKMHTTP